MTDILVDAHNLFFRARHVVRGDDISERVGMSMHIMFASINKVWRDFNGQHVVFCFDRRSWRKDVMGHYKAQRKLKEAALTVAEQDENEAFFEAFDDFKNFLKTQTNTTVLEEDGCEADDFIARWIQNHPDHQHVIVSSDSDFYQLLAENVSQYNGITNQHITKNGIYKENGKPVLDKKTGLPKVVEDPEWILFEKCIRGDSSDNIFSAYPGARKKGTRNKTGMLDAFAERETKGYHWNNFFLHHWTDHNGVEHKVLDDYLLNKSLIDLTAQPDEIKQVMDETIKNQTEKEHVQQIGVKFLQFCGRYNLVRVSDQATQHSRYLRAKYDEIESS